MVQQDLWGLGFLWWLLVRVGLGLTLQRHHFSFPTVRAHACPRAGGAVRQWTLTLDCWHSQTLRAAWTHHRGNTDIPWHHLSSSLITCSGISKPRVSSNISCITSMTTFQGRDSRQNQKPVAGGIATGLAILSSSSHQPRGERRSKEG